MNPLVRPALLFLLLPLLVACGPSPEPESLPGEDEGAAVVNGFLTALQAGDLDLAGAFLYEDPDRVLDDLEATRELLFAIPSTGRQILGQGTEQYGMKWHIYVDVKLSYGKMMKPLRFTLVPGAEPKIRGLNPKPEA